MTRGTPVRRPRAAVAAAAIVVLLGAIAAAIFWPDAPWSPRAGAHSVSVIPLRAIGGNQLQRAADAVTEEMTTGLAVTPGITLRSATRAQAMLRDGADVDQIARRLGVAFIADGSVQGGGSRLRLTVRLLRADDAVAVWANTFDFMPEDLPAVARSVADSVAAVVMRAGS